MRLGFYRGNHMDAFSNGFDESKIETVLRTEKDVICGDVFTFNGKTYVVGSIHRSRDFAQIDEIKIGEGEDKDFEDEITCPYCGYANTDSWESSDSEDEEVCGSCGGVFSYERHVEVTYSSQPVKAPEIKEF
jgi:hypothetical protein